MVVYVGLIWWFEADAGLGFGVVVLIVVGLIVCCCCVLICLGWCRWLVTWFVVGGFTDGLWLVVGLFVICGCCLCLGVNSVVIVYNTSYFELYV